MVDLYRIRKEQILSLRKLGIYKWPYLSLLLWTFSRLSVEQLTGFEPAIQLWKS